MPAFSGMDPVLVDLLARLLDKANRGELVCRSWSHSVDVHGPDQISLDLLDIGPPHTATPTPVIQFRGASPASGSLARALAHVVLGPGMQINTGTKIEELGVTDEVIVGYRDFMLEGSIEDVFLVSRNGTEWPKFKPLTATCIVEGDNAASALRTHDAPELSCNCGIYAFDNPKHEDMDFTLDVWGEIYMWGETYICESGYRSEFAYPKTIFIRSYGTKTTDRIADALREQYGVPVYVMATRDGLTEGDVLEQMILGGKWCTCPAGSYDPGNVHEPYCPLGGDTHNDDSTT